MKDTHEILITVKVPDNWTKRKANEWAKMYGPVLKTRVIRELKNLNNENGVKFSIRICEYGN